MPIIREPQKKPSRGFPKGDKKLGSGHTRVSVEDALYQIRTPAWAIVPVSYSRTGTCAAPCSRSGTGAIPLFWYTAASYVYTYLFQERAGELSGHRPWPVPLPPSGL